jgi:hypothetical protein
MLDSNAIKRLFSEPPRQYSSAPLWAWNDMLTEAQIVATLRDMAEQKVKQVIVHPRPGLMTPYLSDEWFRLYKAALEEAERLDMNIWMYDEYCCPSGFAGGLVPEAMPVSLGRGLVIKEQESVEKLNENAVAVFCITENGYKNVSGKALAGTPLAKGEYLVASIQRAVRSPLEDGWGKQSVDLMYPGVTEKFLEITMDAYTRQTGKHYGKHVRGVFTDETHIMSSGGQAWDDGDIMSIGGLPWTDDLPNVFKKRWGYSLIDNLPSLARPVGDWKRIRHNYLQVLLKLFIDRFAKPYYEYCERHNIEFTGHFWEHAWPNCLMSPDNMAMSAWQHRPAIDSLTSQYSEDTHALCGNSRTVKEISSVANQLGRKRTLCEAFGGSGWEMCFEDIKRISDWLYALGVNTIDEHISYITIRGARKRDWPPAFSYHEPWWKAYHMMAEYFTRLSLVMSSGQQVNYTLVIEPTTSAWMYQVDLNQAEQLEDIGSRFQKMIMSLERTQVEYDIGCEDIIARHGVVEGTLFKVGRRAYNTVVLPPMMENINLPTMNLLEEYLETGGIVLCCGQAPSRVDGKLSNWGVKATKHSGWKQVEPGKVPQILLTNSKNGFAIERNKNDKGILFHHRRAVKDGEFLLLVNTSIDSYTAGIIKTTSQSVEKWNPSTAEISIYPFKKDSAGTIAEFEIAPCGSLLLFLSKEPHESINAVEESSRIIPSSGETEICPVEENVLTLDYVDVTAGGEIKKNIYFYQASKFVFEKNEMERNPWDCAIQFHDEFIKKTFSHDSGFEATYWFTIQQQLPKRLWIVIERPDLYTIKCNGKTISAKKGLWWLDKSFGKIEITNFVKVGKNAITIKASPFTIYHELEPAYILGTFKLKPADSGFIILGDSEPTLELGSWKEQSYPFYAAGVSYTQKFDIVKSEGRYIVELQKWYGSVAEITVNGKHGGYIAYQPWQCDVTDFIRIGVNTIEVVVVGTLKNTLGPHHSETNLGFVPPHLFQKAPLTGPPPGKDYRSIDYGLFEPFVLKQIIRK